MFKADNFFGGIFDIDRDGSTDVCEAALGFMILDELSKEEKDEDDDFDEDEY